MDDQNLRHAHDKRDKRQVLLPVEGHLARHERNGGERRSASETNGVAVGRALGGHVDACEPPGTRACLDHDLLAEFGAKSVGERASE